MRVRRKLLTFANLIEVDLENWTKYEIFAAWRYLEKTARQKLSHRGFRDLFFEIRNVFKDEGLNNYKENEKAVKLFRRKFINERIDKEDTPWKKRNANRPPYATWNQISIAMTNKLADRKFTNEQKRLRLYQAQLMLVWSRASGARIEELLRMKLSDVTVMTMKNGEITYLDLNIRRSKSNQEGKKNLHYKCVLNRVDTELCPVACFERYLANNPSIKSEGDYIFPSSPNHQEFHVNRGPIKTLWDKTSKKLDLPLEYYPMSHSGHDCILCLAYARNKNPAEILDITQWNSMAVMDTYIQGPKINGLNVELATTSVEELDDHIRDVLEFNARVHG